MIDANRSALHWQSYSGFDSALYRKLDAEWHFSQDNATLHDFETATVESKPL
jgi:hypothetical protein